MQKLIIPIFLVLIIPNTFAAQVRITGKAAGAEQKVIRVQAYADLISFKPVTLDKDTISQEGEFSLNFPLEHIAYADLLIDFHSAKILLEPGEEYELEITAFKNPSYREELNPFLEPRYLIFEIKNPDRNPLLASLDSLNKMHDRYLLENFRKLTRGGRNVGTDTLADFLHEMLPYTNAYLETSIEYRIALIDEMAKVASREALMQKYILGKKVQYKHPDYMEFFNSFFSKYLTHVSRSIPYGELTFRINESKDYDAVLDLLGRDSLLGKDQIRELVLLRNLREIYHSPDFRKNAVLEVLDQLAQKTRFKEHRIIARNLKVRLSKLRKGSPAPPLHVQGAGGNALELANYRGKHLYIQFYNSVCEACETDMSAIENLRTEFREDIEFLSISIDVDKSNFTKKLSELPYSWDFAWFMGNFDIVEDYSLRAFPSYILLDREGRIESFPAPGPAGGAELLFRQILSKEKSVPSDRPLPGTDPRKKSD